MQDFKVAIHRHLPHRCDTVFQAILMTPLSERQDPHRILSSKHIWGKRDTVGSQTLLRWSHGTFDLEVIEMILDIDRPLRFIARQTPQRFVPYTPTERVPPLNLDERTPEKAFRNTFGDRPLPWNVGLTLSPNQGGTDLEMSITLNHDKIGWIMKKVVSRQITKRLNTALDMAEATLTTA